ncbi:hypothetical protein B0H15DRAFT_823278 [Mycena belliarum]|uniref:C3H1-type domain-containing protein n=1 Tax=Mycena belliarum TaxID=1033014 RepID=A0AAD6UB86_9AGAR|nr:hypothetical protein B0H15DRAFT_823278 [Mycena belliae]
MASKRSKRCFYFNDQGELYIRDRECPNGRSCGFAHPRDPEWPSAQSSTGHYNRVPSSPSKFPSRRYRSRSPLPRSRSPHRPRSRSPARHTYVPMDPRRSSVASHSQAIPPPPLVPAPPSLPAAFTTPGAAAAPKPATRNEIKVMWDTVLPIMADCVEARKAHQDALGDLANFERMLQSSRYTDLLTPEDKARVEPQLAALKAACEDKARAVTAALNVLKETNWWPVGPSTDTGAAEKYRELIQYALQLNTTATDMYQAYVTKTASRAATTSDKATPDTHESASDARPLKRRRISDATDPVALLDPADGAELEALRDKVVLLEERVAGIHNDLLALGTQSEDDIIRVVDERMEQMALTSAENGSTASDLARVDQRVAKVNKDLDDLGKEVALLMAESAEISQQTEMLRAEKDQDLAELAALKQQFQVYEEESRRDRDAVEALGVALSAYHSRPQPPASLPMDFILAAIDEPVRDAVQSVVRPIVDGMTAELQDTVRAQDSRLYGELWGKIALTLKVVDAVNNVVPGTEKSGVPAS